MVIILFIILALIIIISELGSEKHYKVVKKPDCPPHKWVEKPQPDAGGYLICLKCGRLPGSDNEL